MTRYFLLLLIIAGFFYRLILASLFPHAPIADEIAYLDIASSIKTTFWYAECCTRGFVYPMFIRIVFGLFGVANFTSIIWIQSILDVVVGVLLFFVSLRLFENKLWAWITLILYTFNPITSAYAGLYLTEIIAFLSISGTFYFYLLSEGKLSRFTSGIFLGLFIYNRLMFFYYGVATVFVLLLYQIKRRTLLKKNTLCFVVGFLLMFVYPIISNWVTFHAFTPMPVRSTKKYDFYIGLKVAKFPALLSEWQTQVAPIIKKEGPIVNLMDEKDYNRVMDPLILVEIKRIKENPAPFLVSRLTSLVSLWDKSNLYYYKDPFFPIDRPIIRLGNILFLIFGFLGLIQYIRKQKKKEYQTEGLIMTLLLVFYLTIPLTLRVAEERLTLPAYPLLLLFIPLGLSYSNKKIALKRVKKKLRL